MNRKKLKKLRKRKNKINKRWENAHRENNKIDKEIFNIVTLPKMEKLIGRYFKYYDSVGNKTERWWIYATILRIEGEDFVINQFEERSEPYSIIFQETSLSPEFLKEGWKEISEDEYERERILLIAELQKRA